MARPIQNNASLENRRILVVGIGNAGSKVVALLMKKIPSIKCMAIDTDVKDLNKVEVPPKILIGKKVENFLRGANMLFIIAGLGGGTGAIAASAVAEIARHNGATVVGIVMMPLETEKERISNASKGLAEVRKNCNTVVVIDNNRLVESLPHAPLSKTFRIVNNQVADMMKEVVDTVSGSGMINVDFSNFETIIKDGGVATVGIGESNAPNRAEEAVRNALRNPMFNVSYEDAKGALIHVSGDDHMTIDEVNKVGELVSEMMNKNAVVTCASVNPNLAGMLRVTLMMTGVRSSPLTDRVETMTRQIYNIDPYPESGKALEIDLDLDQIENLE